MRRLAFAVIAVLGLLVVPVTAAHADPSAAPSVSVPSPSPGQQVCTVDSKLFGLTGLVTTANGYAVINRASAGTTSNVYLLNNTCQRNGNPITYKGNPNGGAHDPRDLAVSADGTAFWVADTGDSANRTTVAVWKLSTDGKTGNIYRLTYPQGDVHDADAMVLNGDGTPLLITRVNSGPAGIYKPSAPLDPNSSKGVPLQKVGEFTPQSTGTENKFGPTGQHWVTGGANSPDGKHVVLRTYSDAYEWSVPDGDVVKAITTTTPVITPLPSEAQGEAIAYTRDGKSFVTVSSQDSGVKTQMLSYTPAAPPTATKSAAVAGGTAAASKGDTRSWFSKLTLQQLTYLVGAVGLLGLLMVIGGVLGIRAGRNRTQPVPTMRSRSEDRWPDDGEPATMPAGGYGPAPDPRYPDDPDPYAGAEYPPAHGGSYQGGGGSYQGGVYSSGGGYDSDGGYDANRGYDANQGYNDGGYGGAPGYGDSGRQQGGRTYRAGRGGQETGHYEDGERGGPYSRGGQQDAAYGSYQAGGQQGEYGAPAAANGNGWAPPPAVPAQPTGREAARDGGIARSHRTGRPANPRGTAPPRGGYAEEHEGFDDLRRLMEE